MDPDSKVNLGSRWVTSRELTVFFNYYCLGSDTWLSVMC